MLCPSAAPSALSKSNSQQRQVWNHLWQTGIFDVCSSVIHHHKGWMETADREKAQQLNCSAIFCPLSNACALFEEMHNVILIVNDSDGTLLSDDLIGRVEDCSSLWRIMFRWCVFATAVCWSVFMHIPQDCGCVNEQCFLMLTKLPETVFSLFYCALSPTWLHISRLIIIGMAFYTSIHSPSKCFIIISVLWLYNRPVFIW